MTTSLQPFPTWESIMAQNRPAEVSLDLMRLRWKAFGDIVTAVRVAAHARDPPSDGDEAYYKPDDQPSLHSISESSLTEPPISSITVAFDDLDMREENWVEEHLTHVGDGSDVWEDVDDDDGEEEGRKLVRCCNEDRPYPPAPLVIQASADKGYVTVHDYVVAVHGRLQSFRDEILEERILSLGEQHDSADVQLYIDLALFLNNIHLNDGKPGGVFSLWQRWATCVDRQLGEQVPPREETFHMGQAQLGGSSFFNPLYVAPLNRPAEHSHPIVSPHDQPERSQAEKAREWGRITGADRIAALDPVELLRQDDERRRQMGL